jgi:TonB family protein
MSAKRTLLCGSLGSLILIAGLAAQDVTDSVGPIEKRANAISPENPIPRRSFSVAAVYPAEARGLDASTTVALVATIDETGRVVEIRKVREPVVIPSSNATAATATAQRIAAEGFVREAASALRRWQYDPPAKGPLSFAVTFAFRPGAEATSNQLASAAPPPAPPPPPAAPLPAGTVRVGGNVKAPVQISKVAPVYPLIAQSARVQGIVILEALIGVDGRVNDARVLRSVPLLDQAALDAVKQWQYAPTLLNGVPVPVAMTVTVSFTLPETPTAQPQ